MPYINVKTNVKLDNSKSEQLLTALAKSITAIPGKSEASVMCGVEDGQKMIFRGDSVTAVAFVEVKLLHSSTKQAYTALTEKICEIMQEVVGVSGDRCYVKFEETESWGYNSFMF